MKFKIISTSGKLYDENDEIEFNTLEEFINWCKSKDKEIIINLTDFSMPQLEIYDDWRE